MDESRIFDERTKGFILLHMRVSYSTILGKRVYYSANKDMVWQKEFSIPYTRVD